MFYRNFTSCKVFTDQLVRCRYKGRTKNFKWLQVLGHFN